MQHQTKVDNLKDIWIHMTITSFYLSVEDQNRDSETSCLSVVALSIQLYLIFSISSQ